MNEALKTRCDRKVFIQTVYLDYFASGIFLGEPERTRDHVMTALPDRIRKIFGATSGLYIAPLTVADADENPTWIVVCQLQCHDPISADAHFSMLTCCWFADSIDQPIAQFISPLVADLVWAEHAVDGLY